MKARPLSKRLRATLERRAGEPRTNRTPLSGEARAILAALKHERQAGRREATDRLQREAERLGFTGDAGRACAHVSRAVCAEMDRRNRGLR